MPLPLIPIVIGGFVTTVLGYGAKKGYDASHNERKS